MKTSLLATIPVALMLLTGSAMAQQRDGGGSGNEGSSSGVAEQMTCLTGAYCPPNRYPPSAYTNENCDQVRVRERIPGTNRFRVVTRCQWDRWGY